MTDGLSLSSLLPPLTVNGGISEYPPPLTRVNRIVSELFRAGLALDSLQQSGTSDFTKQRAEAAAAAIDQALSELRVLAVELDDLSR